MSVLNPMTAVIRMIADFKIQLIDSGEKHVRFNTGDVDVSELQFKLRLMDGITHRHHNGLLELKFNCDKACKRFIRTFGTFAKFKNLSDGRLGI